MISSSFCEQVSHFDEQQCSFIVYSKHQFHCPHLLDREAKVQCWQQDTKSDLTTYHIPLTTYQLLITSYHIPLTTYQLLNTTYHIPVTKYQLPLISHSLYVSCPAYVPWFNVFDIHKHFIMVFVILRHSYLSQSVINLLNTFESGIYDKPRYSHYLQSVINLFNTFESWIYDKPRYSHYLRSVINLFNTFESGIYDKPRYSNYLRSVINLFNTFESGIYDKPRY